MRLAIFLVICISIPISASAWWSTDVDTVEVRYPSGQLQEQYQTVLYGGNDRLYRLGFYQSWYENGQLEWDGQYEEGLKSGTWIRWDSTGRRREEIPFLAGEKHGTEIVWNTNGTVKEKLNYRNGKRHGLCVWRQTDYDINAAFNNIWMTVDSESFYLDGVVLVSMSRSSGDEGSILECSGLPSPYYNSELDFWVEWQKWPCKPFVGPMVDGKKDGVWILWTPTGGVERVDYYVKGELIYVEQSPR